MKHKTLFLSIILILGFSFVGSIIVFFKNLIIDLEQLEKATSFPMADETDFLGRG